MIRYGTFTYNSIVGFITAAKGQKLIITGTDGDRAVRVDSLRLQCFKRSPVCVSCGRKGTRFAMEKSSEGDFSAHLNLYCVEGEKEVLMTHDHILPRSKGGTNTLDNVQTMCTDCNKKKDNTIFNGTMMGNLKDLIAELIASGMNDREVFKYVTNVDLMDKIGFKPDGGDFVAIIKMFMTEKPETASVCTECPHMRRRKLTDEMFADIAVGNESRKSEDYGSGVLDSGWEKNLK